MVLFGLSLECFGDFFFYWYLFYNINWGLKLSWLILILLWFKCLGLWICVEIVMKGGICNWDKEFCFFF